MEQETKNLISADDLAAKTRGLTLAAIGTGVGFVGELQAQNTAAPSIRRDPKLNYNN